MKTSLRWKLALATALVAGLLATLLQESTVGVKLELATYDWRMWLRGPLPPPEKAPLTIVQVDDASFERINLPFVFWQPLFARVITAMAEGGAAVIGLDVLFTDVDLVIDELTTPGSRRTESHVRELAAAILTARDRGTPVIVGYKSDEDPGDAVPLSLILAAGEDGAAYVNLTTDPDDFVRRQELYSENQEGRGYSFAMALARAYRGFEDVPYVAVPEKPTWTMINYRGRAAFPRVSFWEAKEAAEAGDRKFFEQFRGRIVLMGLVSDDDRHPTPLYSWVDDSERRQLSPGERKRRNPGVEIHAHAVATLLEGDFIRPLTRGSRVFCVLLLAAMGAAFCFLLPQSWGLAFSLGLMPAYFVVAQGLFNYGIWIPLAAPLVGLLLALAGGQLANYALVGREKRRLRGLFKRYVDDRVIERILEKPDLALEGECRQISVLFSDIRDFTGRSESMGPEELVDLLNRYFELMVDAIQSSKGMVDKFIGDGIMAVFGAPLDDRDSAFNATLAALRMQVALRELNLELESENRPPIKIGVGVHTGEAVVGNIGSPERLEYTAIGDVVNTASRIEGLNKKYGTSILISEETFQALEGRIPADALDETLLKGKTRPIKIYQVDATLEPGRISS